MEENHQTIQSKKTELEERKLQLEILELERPWYKKPTFLVPIIGALSSILVLWITGFFNTKIETLTTKREQLSFETMKLKEIKTELITDSINLAKAKESLQIDTAQLSQKITYVTSQYDSLKSIFNKIHAEAIDNREKNKSLSAAIESKKIELSRLSDSLSIATKPNLTIGLRKIFIYEDMDIGIYVTNTGTGIAYFKNVNFYYNGETFIGTEKVDDFWERVINALGLYRGYLNWQGKQLSNSIDKAGSLGPGQSYATLRVAKSRSNFENIQTFLKAIKGLEIEIIFQSVTGKEFICRHKFSAEECEIK